MSSLMQFTGAIRRGKVGLEYVLVDAEGHDIETYTCVQCGKQHALIRRFWRKPTGMFGVWVTFDYLSETHAPDLSIPLSLRKNPKGFEVLTSDESSTAWHRE